MKKVFVSGAFAFLAIVVASIFFSSWLPAFAAPPSLISPTGHHAATIAAGATPAAMTNAARDFCKGKQWCQVLAWTADGARAAKMPLTDHEAGTLAFSYTVNRSTGMDKAVWDCGKWPGRPDQCMAKPAS